MKKGDICLIDFGKSRDSFSFGKNRPAIIFQTDKLNFAVNEGIYEYFLVIPLSTAKDIVTSDFRYKITSRDKLKVDSFAVCNSICFLHKKYVKEKLATLSENEIDELNFILKDVLDI